MDFNKNKLLHSIKQRLTLKQAQALPRDFVDRVRAVVFGEREPASRSYRYISRLMDQDFHDLDAGASFCLASPDTVHFSTNAILMLGHSLRYELEARVLLIDATLKYTDGSLSDRLGVRSQHGFNYLSCNEGGHPEDYVQPTGVEGISILPSGFDEDSLHTLPKRENLTALITTLAQSYDYCLYQQGSILSDTRYLSLGRLVDQNFLILEENKTLMSKVTDSQKVYRDNGVDRLKLMLAE